MSRIIALIVLAIISISIVKANPFPRDVTKFITKRNLCDHLRGEFFGVPEIDEERDLNTGLRKYCKGSGKALVSLKVKYQNDYCLCRRF